MVSTPCNFKRLLLTVTFTLVAVSTNAAASENLSPPPPPAGPLPIPYPIQGGKRTEAARPPSAGLLEDGLTATPPSSVRGRSAKDLDKETPARSGGLNRALQAK